MTLDLDHSEYDFFLNDQREQGSFVDNLRVVLGLRDLVVEKTWSCRTLGEIFFVLIFLVIFL